VSPDVFWKIRNKLLGFPEPEIGILKELCDPARDGLDVGANYGMYTQALRRCCRKVWSFEPQPHFATLLENGYRCDIEAGRLVLYRCALSDTAGHATLRTPLLDRGYSTIEAGNEMDGKVNCSRGVAELTVETKRLDDIELESPGFIKIDVEGHEECVLRGAVATLERHRPNLLVEVENRHREGSVGRVAALLKALGYSGFYLDDDRLVSLDHFRPEVNQNAEFPDKYKRNFIFRPSRVG
jgi:FkbM family methyltransferase